jgi:hypothetical protein
MNQNGKRSNRGLASVLARTASSAFYLFFTGAMIIAAFMILETSLNAAQITGKALLAADQKTPAPGVWVTVTYHLGDKVEQRKKTTGSDGSYSVEIPDTAAAPMAVKYSKAGQTIIVETEPLSEGEVKSNKPRPPVFVHPTNEIKNLNTKALATILQIRGESLSPQEKQIQVTRELKQLQTFGIDEGVLKAVEEYTITEKWNA